MTLDKIAYLLADMLGTDEEDITAETPLTPEEGIEPIDLAKLVILVEKKFKLTIYDDEAAAFRTVGDLVRYVERVREGE